jgi:hypothetical protein
MSTSPGDSTLLSSPVDISDLKETSAPASGGTVGKTTQQSTPEESATLSANAAAPQVNTSLGAGAQMAASPPEPAIAVTFAKTHESATTPAHGGATVLSDNAGNNMRSGWPINNTARSMIIFPILAIGLALLGIGARLLAKHSAAGVAQTVINERQLAPVTDEGSRGARDNQQELVVEGQELSSLISAVSDQGTSGADGDAVQAIREISNRRYRLAHLRQHIERMLRSAAGPYAESHRANACMNA